MHGDRLREPWTAAAALGGPEIALLAGVTLGAAERRVPVVLDGLVTSIAALLAVLAEPGAAAALIAGQRSGEAARTRRCSPAADGGRGWRLPGGLAAAQRLAGGGGHRPDRVAVSTRPLLAGGRSLTG